MLIVLKNFFVFLTETTSESGISDLDMSEKCNCCPYGFHIDTDFVKFLETLDSKNLVKQLKKIQRKRNERIQRSMEYVIDEVEKIKQLNDIENNTEQQLHYTSRQFQQVNNGTPTTYHVQHHYRRIQDQSPSRALITDTLKKTINRIDQEINRDFDAKTIIEQHKQRLNSRSNSRRREISPSPRYGSKSRSPSRHKRSTSGTSIANSEKLFQQQTHIQQQQQQQERRSRSGCRHRSKSHSKSPRYVQRQEEYDSRFVTTADDADEEEILMQGDNLENRVETMTRTYQQVVKTHQSPSSFIDTSRLIQNPIDVPPSHEITLNVVSLSNANLAGTDSSSSESLNSDDVKLKINEPERPLRKPQQPLRKPPSTPNNDELYRRISELEKKLSKLPELELKNSVLLEERNLLIKQLQDRQQKKPIDLKSVGVNVSMLKEQRDIGVECKSNTRDVGVLHVREQIEEEKKFVEMAAMINTLREKLDEQTLTMQKPPTRDVAVMHQVDKVEQKNLVSRGTEYKVPMRDVAINHVTEDEQQKAEIESFMAQQKVITNNYIRELEVLKKENVQLSATLEEALKKRVTHVTTRGTSTPDGPQLFSVGVNTQSPAKRDVQVMFTPKSRDVSLSTDRFNFTRDVNLYCNLDHYEDYGEECVSALSLLKGRKKTGPKEYRDVCIGVNCLPQPEQKVLRDVKIGVNMDKLKELRDVSIGCQLDYKPKVQTRDVSMRVNFDEMEKKQYRDACVGIQKEMHDASIFVNTIEPVKLPEKPQMKSVWLDTSTLHAYKDSCVGPDLKDRLLEQKQTRSASTDTHSLVTKRDVISGSDYDLKQLSKQTSTHDFILKRDAESLTMPQSIPKPVQKRDSSVTANMEDTEKIEMARELAQFKMIVPKSTREIGISVDYINRLTSNLVHNSSTTMDAPKLVHKHQNTDLLYKRDSYSNTDKPLINVSHKASGDFNVNDVQISASEYNSLKAQLNKIETQKKEVKTQGVGLCSIYDTFEQKKATNTIACGDCKVDGNFCDKCSFKDIRSTGVGTQVNTRNASSITEMNNLNERIGVIQQSSMDEMHSEEFTVEIPVPKSEIKESSSSLVINVENQQQQQQQNLASSSDNRNKIETVHIRDVIIQKTPKLSETRKETEFEQRKLTRIDGNKKLIKETIKMKSSGDDIPATSENSTWETVIEDGSLKRTSLPSNTSSTTSITIPINSTEKSESLTKLVLKPKQLVDNTLDDSVTTISTEEVTYKDGEVAGKRITGR